MWSFKKNIYRTRREDEVTCPDCVAHNVTIGTQVWTGCNADTEFYRNEDPIPYVDNSTTWASLTTGAWCYYDNNPSNGSTYGKLYNWYAITDPRGIAPDGYHVPTDTEWNTLIANLGGLSIAGGKLKEDGLCHWISPNTDATNISGFTGLPGGVRSGATGSFSFLGSQGLFTGSSLNIEDRSCFVGLQNIYQTVDISYGLKRSGLSLRFIKDVCPDVNINDQIWTSCNLDVATYRDGTLIPESTMADPLPSTTGSWCWPQDAYGNIFTYGRAYNWAAVNNTTNGGIAPDGYHVASDTEVIALATYLGGLSVAGGKLKEVGTTHWLSPNTGATDDYNFKALPGGWRTDVGTTAWSNAAATWWTSTSATSTHAYRFAMEYNTAVLTRGTTSKGYWFFVRLVKD